VWASLHWEDRLSVESRVKEHYWHIPLGQMERSTMEEHNFNSENTKILSTKSRHMDQNTKKVIKTELDPNKVFSRSWKLPIHSLMEQRKAPCEDTHQ
jgi:hypothetical protein